MNKNTIYYYYIILFINNFLMKFSHKLLLSLLLTITLANSNNSLAKETEIQIITEELATPSTSTTTASTTTDKILENILESPTKTNNEEKAVKQDLLQFQETTKVHEIHEIPTIPASSSETSTNKNQGIIYSIAHSKPKVYTYWVSFVTGFNLIFFSEVGDKTFLLTMFFAGKLGALITFFVASCTMFFLNAFWLLVGASLSIFIYKPVIDWVAVALFFGFGTVLMYQGCTIEDKNLIDEYKNLETEIAREAKVTDNELKDIENNDPLSKPTNLNEKLLVKISSKESVGSKSYTPLFGVLCSFSFSLILAECGDRSQITAVTIAAVYDFQGVLLGSSIAHVLAALLAVTIGQWIAQHLSEKTISMIGSCLFYLYALEYVYSNLNK